MKKVISLALLSAIGVAGGSNFAKAVEVQNAFDFGLGYTAQVNRTGQGAYSIDYLESIADDEEEGAEASTVNKYTNTINQLSLYAGYNAVFKVNDYFNPILGAFVSGNIPLNNYYTQNVYENAKKEKKVSSDKRQVSNVFDINVKFGNEFNVNKNVKLDVYSFVGMNVGIVKSSTESYLDEGLASGLLGDDDVNPTNRRGYVGLSAGAGVDAIFCDRYVVGAFYKYTDLRVATENNSGVAERVVEHVLNTASNVGIKLGFRF